MSEAGKAARTLALQAFVQGRFDDAITAFGQALAEDAADREALRGLAMAHGQKGDSEGAVRWATRLTEVAPQETLSWATLSMLLQKQGKIKEAEDAQAKARTLSWKDQLNKPPA